MAPTATLQTLPDGEATDAQALEAVTGNYRACAVEIHRLGALQGYVVRVCLPQPIKPCAVRAVV